jgi:hypothetical protein
VIVVETECTNRKYVRFKTMLSGSPVTTAWRFLGGDGLEVWRVAANILNKQSRTTDRGWSSSLGVERGLTTPHRKILTCYVTF